MDLIHGLGEPPGTGRIVLAVISLVVGMTGNGTVLQGGTPTAQKTYSAPTATVAVARPMTESSVSTVLDPTASFESVQGVLLDICAARGYGQDCAKTLLGMLWKESQGNGHAVGDHGKALGWFQIHYHLHGIAASCATDLRCSAGWTLHYLERNGYPRYPSYAIQCHNGCNAGNGYTAAVRRLGQNLWDTPMFLHGGQLAAR